MVLYEKREMFNSISVKVGILFSKFGLTPNQWTMLSLLPAIAAFYLLFQQQFLVAAAFFIVAGFLDFVDGSVARVTGRVSRFGAYLDTVVDRYIEFLVILGLFFVPAPAVISINYNVWILVYLFGAMMTTYAKAAAREKELVEKEIKGGLLERAERISLLFMAIIAAQFSLQYLSMLIAVLAVATNLTALQRIMIARKNAKT